MTIFDSLNSLSEPVSTVPVPISEADLLDGGLIRLCSKEEKNEGRAFRSEKPDSRGRSYQVLDALCSFHDKYTAQHAQSVPRYAGSQVCETPNCGNPIACLIPLGEEVTIRVCTECAKPLLYNTTRSLSDRKQKCQNQNSFPTHSRSVFAAGPGELRPSARRRSSTERRQKLRPREDTEVGNQYIHNHPPAVLTPEQCVNPLCGKVHVLKDKRGVKRLVAFICTDCYIQGKQVVVSRSASESVELRLLEETATREHDPNGASKQLCEAPLCVNAERRLFSVSMANGGFCWSCSSCYEEMMIEKVFG